ncbi:MAG: hypothetical protein OYH77_07290 [Pseudomonadota bacterium]|nr:hypothetical protein [Pseudomonadota bacterium]
MGLARLLLLGFVCLSACKVFHRDREDSAYELHAVSDNYLTLGAVPIEDEYGDQAYRLLLCKNSITFPKWMLNDDSRCRPALLMPESKEEALLLPGQINQNFAQKFKGDLKYLAVLSTVTAAFCAATLFGSKWILKNFKTAGHFKKAADIKQVSAKKSKIDYINALRRYDKAENSSVSRVALREREADLLEKSKIYDAALKLESTHTLQDLLQAMRKRLDEGEDASDLVAAFKAKNSKAIADLRAAGKEHANIDEYAKEIEHYEELNNAVDKYLNADRTTVGRQLTKINDEKRIRLDDYRSQLHGRVYGIAGWNVEKIRNSIAVSAGHVGSFSLLYSINRSIWGYDDRMVSKYWSSIFLLNDDFSQPAVVASIPLILQKLADTFELEVNAAALQLKDEGSRS